MSKITPIKNNNPWRLRYKPANNFAGQYHEDKDGFCQFKNLQFGFRAAFLLYRRWRDNELYTINELCYYYMMSHYYRYTTSYSRLNKQEMVAYISGSMSEHFNTPYSSDSSIIGKAEIIYFVFCLTCYVQNMVDFNWLDVIEAVYTSVINNELDKSFK